MHRFADMVGPTLRRYGYRKETLGLLQQLVRDMDRKIERQRDRAAKESENRIPTPQEQSQLDELKVSCKCILQMIHRLPTICCLTSTEIPRAMPRLC